MPPRTALFEIATRSSNNYVCRSCLTAQGIVSPSPQRSSRGYARKARQNARPSARPSARPNSRPNVPPQNVRPQSVEPAAAPQDDTSGHPVRVKYFEKDPKTGKITPVPEVEDDGEPEPSLADLARLGRSMMTKVDMLDETFARLDQLNGPLEKLLVKHGPPGALEAYRLALKSYDDPASVNAPDGDLEADLGSSAKVEDALQPLRDATLSGTKHEDMPELDEAFGVVQDSFKRLVAAAKRKPSDEDDHDLAEDDNDFEQDLFDMFPEDSERGVIDGKKSSTIIYGRQGAKGTDNRKRSEVVDDKKNAKLKSPAARFDRLETNEDPSIIVDRTVLSKGKFKKLSKQRDDLIYRIRASMEARNGLTDLKRKGVDLSTFYAFRAIGDALAEPYMKPNNAFWSSLWTIFSHEGPSNPTQMRMNRVRHLAEMMLRAGVPLTNAQTLLGIEATYDRSQPEKALAWWKRLVATVGNLKEPAGLAFWELGIRLWCSYGDIGRAERACKALLDRSTPSNPADTSVLLHLISAYCAKPETSEQGFLFYRRMRDLAIALEKPMEIQDYDNAISLFLVTGHTDYAMFAFTDMMFAGTVNLYGKAKLPSSVRNSFFFGKWLKRLIGAGDLDSAFSVLVFMQKNGVMAAAIQLNGLIGAWLRTGTTVNRAKAYKLAWAMIDSRESFVNLRKREVLVEWPVRLLDNRPNDSNHDETGLDYGIVPRATGETFVIMAGEYRERSLFGRLEELFVAYKKCEMPGDSMMMNELLAGVVAQGRGDKAVELYKLMVHDHDIVPRTDTFAILFSSLPVNTSRVPIVNNAALIAISARNARIIFADMMRSAWVFGEQAGGERRKPAGPLTEPQAKLILHTFRKAEDWAGLSVALIGLRDVLEFRLTRGVVLEMIEGVQAMDRPTARMAKVIVRATMTLQHLVAEMQLRGQLPSNATEEGMKDWKVLYNILLQWYHMKLQAQEPLLGSPDLMLQQAKEDMGLGTM